MPISFRCPTCQSVLTLDDNCAGLKTVCLACNQRLLVPTPPAPVAPQNKTVLGTLEPEGGSPAAPATAEPSSFTVALHPQRLILLALGALAAASLLLPWAHSPALLSGGQFEQVDDLWRRVQAAALSEPVRYSVRLSLGTTLIAGLLLAPCLIIPFLGNRRASLSRQASVATALSASFGFVYPFLMTWRFASGTPQVQFGVGLYLLLAVVVLIDFCLLRAAYRSADPK